MDSDLVEAKDSREFRRAAFGRAVLAQAGVDASVVRAAGRVVKEALGAKRTIRLVGAGGAVSTFHDTDHGTRLRAAQQVWDLTGAVERGERNTPTALVVEVHELADDGKRKIVRIMAASNAQIPPHPQKKRTNSERGRLSP